MAQMKEQIKATEIALSDEEIANLSYSELKTLVIRMLIEMVQYGRKIEEKVKAMQSEIKKNIQGTNSEGKETGTQVNNLEQKEEINIQPEQNEETIIQNSKERLRNLWNNFKCSNIRIIGMPEGEKEEQEIENLLEKIVMIFPNLSEETDFHKVQEAQRVSEKLDPRKHTPRPIIITLPKIKHKERILKAARENKMVTYKGVPIRPSADFSKETLQARRGWKEVFEVMKGKDLHPRLL